MVGPQDIVVYERNERRKGLKITIFGPLFLFNICYKLFEILFLHNKLNNNDNNILLLIHYQFLCCHFSLTNNIILCFNYIVK